MNSVVSPWEGVRCVQNKLNFIFFKNTKPNSNSILITTPGTNSAVH